jgi:hypothetical protein
MTALLIITLLGSPNVVKHRELPLEQCRPVARMLTERDRIHARCAILPSRESYGHSSMEPRKGRLSDGA